MPICQQCGTAVPDGVPNCASCGALQAQAPQGEPIQPTGQPAGPATTPGKQQPPSALTTAPPAETPPAAPPATTLESSAETPPAAPPLTEAPLSPEKQAQMKEVSGSIESLMKDIQDAKGKELDISEAEGLAKKASEALKGDNFSRARSYVREAQEVIAQSKTRQLAWRLLGIITTIEGKINESKKLGIDVSESEDLIAAAKGHYDGNRLGEAKEMVRRAKSSIQTTRERYVKTRMVELIDNAKKGLEEARAMGASVAASEVVLRRAEGYRDQGDIQNLERTITEVQSLVSASIKNYLDHQRKRLDERFTSVSATISSLTTPEVDMKEAQDLLASAKEALQKDDFKGSEDLLSQADTKAKELRTQAHVTEARTLLDETKKLLTHGENIGANVTRPKVFYTSAAREFERKDYEQAISSARNAQEETYRAIAAKETELHDEVSSLLTTVEQSIGSSRGEGIDVSQMQQSLQLAMSHLQEKDFFKAKEEGEKAKVQLDRTISDHLRKQTEETLAQVATLEAQAKILGADLTSSDDLQKRSREATAGQKMREASDLASNALTAASQAIERRNAELVQESSCALTSTQEVLMDAQSKAVDTSLMQDIFNMAKKAHTDGDFQRAIEMAKRAREDTSRFLEQQLMRDLTGQISSIEDDMRRAKQIGAGTEKVQEFIDNSKASRDNKEFDRSQELIIEAQLACKTAIDVRTRELTNEAVTLLQKGRAIAIELKDLGIDVTHYSDQFEMSKQLFEKGDFLPVIDIAKKVIEQGTSEKERYLTKEVKGIITQIEAAINEGSELGADMDQVKAMLTKINTVRSVGDLTEALDQGKQSLLVAAQILKKRKEELSWEAISSIKDVRNTLIDMKGEGIDITLLEGRLSDTKTLFEQDRFLEVLKLVDELNEMAQNEKEAFFTKQNQEAMNKVSERMQYAEGLGIDTAGAIALLDQARSSLSKLDFGGASNRTTEASHLIEELIEVRKKELQKECEVQLGSVRNAIIEIRELGVDTTPTEEMFQQAQPLFEKEYYFKVLDLGKEILAKVEEEKETHLIAQVNSKISEVRDRIEDGKKYKIEVTDIEEHLTSAKGELDAKEFARAQEQVTKADQILDERTSSRKQEHTQECIELLQKVRDAIVANKQLGVDTTHLESQFKETQPAFDSQDFFSVLEIGNTILEQAKGDRDSFLAEKYTAEAQEIEKLLDKVEQLKIDVATQRENLERARAATGEKDFDKAGSLLHDTRETATSQITSREEELSNESIELIKTVRESLASAKEFGAQTQEIETSFSEVKTFYDERRFLETIETLNDIQGQVDSARSQFFAIRYEEALTDIGDLREQATALDADFSSIEESLTKGTSAKESEDFEDAFNIASEALESSKVLISERKEVLSNECVQMLTDLRDQLHELQELGIEITPFREELGSIKVLFDNEDYPQVKERSEKIKENAEISRQDHLTSQIRSAQDEVKATIEEGQKYEIDPKDALSLLDEVKGKLDEKDFDGARSRIEEARSIINELLKKKHEELNGKAIEVVQVLKSNIHEAKDLGADTQEAEDVFSRFKPLFEERDFFGLFRLAEEGESLVANATDNYHVETIEKEIEEVETLLVHAEELDLDMGEQRSTLTDARNDAGNKDYDDAHSKVSNCSETIKEKVDTRQSELQKKAIEVLTSFKAELTRSKEMGVETTAIGERIAGVKPLFQEEKYKEVLVSLEEIDAMYTKAKNDFLLQRYDATKEEVQSLLEKGNVIGADLQEVSDFLAMADRATSENDYDKADKAATQALESANELIDARKEELSKDAVDALTQTRTFLDECSKEGLDLSQLLDAFAKTKPAFEEERFFDVVADAKDILEKAKIAKEHLFKDRLVSQLSKLDEAVSEGRELQVDVSELQEHHQNAQRLFEEKNYTQAEEEINEAMTSIVELLTRRKLDRFKESVSALGEAKAEMTKATEDEVDVSEAKTRFGEAKAAMESKDFVTMETIAADVVSFIKTARETKAKSIIDKQIQDIEEAIEKAKSLTGDTSQLEEDLIKMRAHRDQENFDDATEMGEKILTDANDLVSQRKEVLSNETIESVKRVRTIIQDAKELGIEITDAQQKFSDAKPKVQEEDYVSALSLLEEAEGIAIDVKRDFMKNEIDGALASIDTLRGEADYIELSLEEIDEKLDGIKKEMEEGGDIETVYKDVNDLYTLLDTSITEKKDELKKTALASLKETKVSIDEAKEEGVDVDEAKSLYTDAKPALEASDFPKIMGIIKEVNETLETLKSEHYKEETNQTLEKIQSLLEKTKELELDIEEEESTISDIKSSLEEGNVLSAKDMATSLSESLEDRYNTKMEELTKEADEDIAHLEKKLEDALELELDVSHEKFILTKAKTALESENLPTALDLISQTKDLMRETLSKYYKEDAEKAVEELNLLSSTAEGLEADITDLVSDRDLILSMMEREDFQDAKDLAIETNTKFQSVIDTRKKELHKESVTSLQETKQLMASYKEKEIDITDAKEIFLDAKNKLEEEDYMGVFQVVDNVKNTLEKSEEEHYLKILTQRKDAFDKQVSEAEQLDVEVGEFKELFTSVQNDFDNAEYEGAIALADTTIKSTEERLEEKRKVVMKDAVAALKSIKELSTSMKGDGIDISEAMEVFGKAKPALGEKDFPTVFSIAEEVNSLLKEAKDKHEHDTISTLITDVEALFEKADRVEVDVTKQREIITQVKIALEAKDYEAALKVATEVKTTVEVDLQEKMELLYKDAMEVMNKVKKAKAELEDLGAQTTSIDESLEKTKEAYNEKDYAMVISICEEALSIADTTRMEYKRELVNTTLEKITELKGDAVKFSLDMTQIDELVENAKGQLEAGELDEAMARSLEAWDKLSAMIEEKVSDKRDDANKALTGAKEASERAVTVGVEIPGIDDRLTEISDAIESLDFENAHTICTDVVSTVDNAIKDSKESGVQEKLDLVSSLISEANELDADPGEAPELLTRSQEALTAQDFTTAEEVAQQATQLLNSNLLGRRKEVLREAVDILKSTKGKMAKAKGEGIDIQPVKEVFIEAKELIKDPSNAQKALAIAKRTGETLTEITIEFYKARIQEELPPVKDLLQEATDIFAEVEQQKEAITEIQEAAGGNDLDSLQEAYNRISETKSALEESIRLQKAGMVTRAEESISSTKSLLEEIQRMGGTVTDAATLIDDAQTQFHSGNFKETIGITNTAKERLNNIKNELLKGRVSEQLEEIRAVIDEGKKLDAQMTPAEERLSKASKAIDGNDFTKANEILDNAIALANDIIDERKRGLTSSVKRELQKARTMILDAKVAGVDITEAKEYFIQAKEHLKEQEYEKVIEMAMKVVSAIEEQGKGFEMDRIRRAIEVSRGGLIEGESMGLDMSEAASSLDQAESLLKANDEEGAQELVVKADEMISTSLKSKMEVSIADAKDAVNAAKEKLKELKAEGANIAPAQKTFLEIKELFKQGSHVEAKAKADETMRIAQEIEKEFKRGMYEKMIDDAKEAVAAATQKGFDLTDANNRIASATSALEAGAFDEAEAESTAAMKSIEKVKASAEKRKQFLAKKALNLLKSVRTNILKANEGGKDVSLSTEVFKKAKASLEEKDYDKAISFAREAESSIGKNLDEAPEEVAEAPATEAAPSPEEAFAAPAAQDISQADIDTMIETLELVSSVIDRARNAGLDVSIAEELEDQAREAYNNKDFQTVILLSNRIREEVERIQGESTHAKAQEPAQVEAGPKVKVSDALETLKEVRSSMSEIKATGVDITSAEEVFMEVDSSLKQRDFSKAVEIAKKAERMAMLARGEIPEDEEEEAAVAPAPPEPAAPVEEAPPAPEFKPTVPAPTGDETPQELNKIAMMAIRAAQAAISKARTSGANVSKAEDAFLDAESALLKKDFSRLIEIASQAERYAFEARNKK